MYYGDQMYDTNFDVWTRVGALGMWLDALENVNDHC